jgi:uncharacterized protein
LELTATQWVLGASAALLVGISKTGVPGVGILVVSMLAAAFGGRHSIGVMLPMLIFADCFAVFWYHRHAQWDKLRGLFLWVIIGLIIGSGALWIIGENKSTKDILTPIIGVIVLLMLALHLLQGRLGPHLTPTSKAGVAGTGVIAGFTTTVSNAAGPVMNIYMTAHKMPKEQFMGTIAWYFLIINVSKAPIYAWLTAANPHKPIFTHESLLFNLLVAPAILAGVFAGRWLLPRVSQKFFDNTVLILAGAAALKSILWG